MQIVIPRKMGDVPYSRKEMEEYLRENLMKNSMNLRMLALKYYKLDQAYYISSPIIVILHWVLDRMIDEGQKADGIKVVGEKIGLAPARNAETYKIKEYDPRGDNGEFMVAFTKQLGRFITRKLAMMPGDNEGVKLDELNRYIEVDDSNYTPPPTPPGVSTVETTPIFGPILTPSPQPMPTTPPTPTRRSRKAPVPASQPQEVASPTSLNLELLMKSIKGEIQGFDSKIDIILERMDALDARLVRLEAKG